MGMKAKDVPCTMGIRAPTGPKVMVWNSVATPAMNIDNLDHVDQVWKLGRVRPKAEARSPRHDDRGG